MKAFFVPGKPIPQGSLRVYNGHIVHNKGPELRAWREKIVWAAKSAKVELSLEPIRLTLAFTLEKPKTVKRDKPTVPPDLDKLIRNCGDALTGLAWKDDAQIVEIYAIKVYGENPGVEIQIAEIKS